MCSQRLAKGVCGTEFVIGTVVFGREVRPVIYFVLTIFDTAEKSVQNLVFFFGSKAIRCLSHREPFIFKTFWVVIRVGVASIITDDTSLLTPLHGQHRNPPPLAQKNQHVN